MKPVFGMLLIGGGVILIVGLFSGKIAFPLNFASVADPFANTPSTQPVVGGNPYRRS